MTIKAQLGLWHAGYDLHALAIVRTGASELRTVSTEIQIFVEPCALRPAANNQQTYFHSRKRLFVVLHYKRNRQCGSFNLPQQFRGGLLSPRQCLHLGSG